MKVHAHILVLDQYDVVAYTSKLKVLDDQAEEMKRQGLPVQAAHPKVFHHSVTYQPYDLTSDQLYVVNLGQIAHMSFDHPEFALSWAEKLQEKVVEQQSKDKVSINIIPLDRQQESDWERQVIRQAVHTFQAE